MRPTEFVIKVASFLMGSMGSRPNIALIGCRVERCPGIETPNDSRCLDAAGLKQLLKGTEPLNAQHRSLNPRTPLGQTSHDPARPKKPARPTPKLPRQAKPPLNKGWRPAYRIKPITYNSKPYIWSFIGPDECEAS